MAYQRDYLISLRVFEPVELHGKPKRISLTRRSEVERMVGADADARLISLPPNPVATRFRDTPLLLPGTEVGDGRDRVCPVQDDIRSWYALDALVETTSRAGLDEVVPKPARRKAHARRVAWMNTDPDDRIYTKTSAWEVSPIWWVALDPETDTIVDEARPAGGRRVMIRADLLTASARAEWALDIMKKKSNLRAVVESAEAFLDWLDSFEMSSILELDLGGMSDVLWPDTGAQLVTDWLDALDSDDQESAGLAFEAYTDKWERTSLYARSS